MKLTTAVNEAANPVGTLSRKYPAFSIAWHLYRAVMAGLRLMKGVRR